MKILRNAVTFVILYFIFMCPTYILPYLGSNSAANSALSYAASGGAWIVTLIHFGSLLVLIVLTWFRGYLINKKWLIIFPILATAFDFLPLLSLIPLIPTMMHLLAIIVGVIPSRAIVPQAS